ncbi:site-specific integrase [Kingella negevensis]|nr:site-specific integrase [Kingella negevensis]MDK4685437.1 site-specific integrase [Kingella negevensis]MDK4698352.1 site-specific integrase [Kingella negevensis]MDK4707293.1 site-specific integrase [Kingella negevensis]MDK4710229.1 site-specific integrase [Kingella negevensis]
MNVFYRSELLNIPLPEIKPQDFATYRDVRLKSVKSSTVNRELAILPIICELAMREWGLLYENPIRKISKPKNPKERTRRPTQQEINDICTTLIYNLNEPPELIYQRVAAAFLFAIETAMHAGKIVGLIWNNIDFTRRLAHLPMTKNGHSRYVPLSKRAIEILSSLKGIDEHRVFAFTSQTLDTIFRWARDRCQIQDLHFHDSRREALTRMSKKVPVETSAKISGLHQIINFNK